MTEPTNIWQFTIKVDDKQLSDMLDYFYDNFIAITGITQYKKCNKNIVKFVTYPDIDKDKFNTITNNIRNRDIKNIENKNITILKEKYIDNTLPPATQSIKQYLIEQKICFKLEQIYYLPIYIFLQDYIDNILLSKNVTFYTGYVLDENLEPILVIFYQYLCSENTLKQLKDIKNKSINKIEEPKVRETKVKETKNCVENEHKRYKHKKNIVQII